MLKWLGAMIFAVVSTFGLTANAQTFTNGVMTVYEGSTNAAPVVGAIGGINVSNWLAVTVAPTLPGTSATGLTNYTYVAPSVLVTNALDSFQYQVILSDTTTNTVLQPIYVIQVNDAPQLTSTNIVFNVNEDTPTWLNMSGWVTDEEDTLYNWWVPQNLVFAVTDTTGVTAGKLDFWGSTAALFTPSLNTNNVTNSFVFTATDRGGLTVTATARIAVNPVSDATISKNEIIFVEKQAGVTNGTVRLSVNDIDVPHLVGDTYNTNFTYAIQPGYKPSGRRYAAYGDGWYVQVSTTGDVWFVVTATNQVVDEVIRITITQLTPGTGGGLSATAADVHLYYGPKNVPALVDPVPKETTLSLWDGQSQSLSVVYQDSATNSIAGSTYTNSLWGMKKVEWYVDDGVTNILWKTDVSPVTTNGIDTLLSSSFTFSTQQYNLVTLGSNYWVSSCAYDVNGNVITNGWSIDVAAVDAQVLAIKAVTNVVAGANFTVDLSLNTTNTVLEWQDNSFGYNIQTPGFASTFNTTNTTPVFKALRGVDQLTSFLWVRAAAFGKYDASPWQAVPINITVPINTQSTTILSNGNASVVSDNTVKVMPSKSSYNVNDKVTIVATPAAGYVFVAWHSPVLSGSPDGGWQGASGSNGQLATYIVQPGHDSANLNVVAIFKSISALMKPVVVNPGPQTSYVNIGSVLQLVAINDSSNVGTTLSAAGLPTGLRLLGSSIVGTPTAAGVFTVTLTATNAKGPSDPVTFTWTVSALPGWITRPVVQDPGPQTSYFNVAKPYGVGLGTESYWLISANLRVASTYSVAGLPPGLSLRGSTILGSPLSTGVFNVVVIATNAAGASDPLTFTWTVLPLPSWVQGTYVGWVNDMLVAKGKLMSPSRGSYTRKNEDGPGVVAIDANGKSVGKFMLNGSVYTFRVGTMTESSSSSSGSSEGSTLAGFDITLPDHPASSTLPLVLRVREPEMGGSLGDVAVPAGIVDRDTLGYDVSLSRTDATDAAVTNYDGYYTLSLPSGTDYGSGYLTMTVKRGNAKVAGKLADGTPVSFDATLFKQFDGYQNNINAILYASPAKYRRGVFGGQVEFTTNSVGRKIVKVTGGIPACDGTLAWANNDPTSTGDYLPFARMLTVQGGIFSSLATIANYYVSGVVVPELDYAKGIVDYGDDNKKVKQLVGAGALGVQLADGTWLTPNGMAVGSTFGTAKADSPGKNKDGTFNYQNDSNKDGQINETALTMSLVNKGSLVTGIFRGTFNSFYDYVSAEDLTLDKQVMAHTVKKVRVEGVMVPNREAANYVEGAGFFLWPRRAILYPGEGGNNSSTTFNYMFNESYDFNLIAP